MSKDTITDDDVLEAVARSLNTVTMQRPLDEIAARGRGLRKRRRAVTGSAVAGVLGASIAVVLSLPSAGGSGQTPSAVGSGQTLSADGYSVNVDMAGWSVHTTASSAVSVTLHQVFSDPAGLQRVLEQAGVRAVVRSVAPNTWSTKCPSGPPTFELVRQVFTVHAPNKATGDQVVNIDPSAMPVGSVLNIVVYQANPQPAARQNPQTLVVTLVHGDPGMCVLPPPMMAHPQVSPVSVRK